MENEGIWLQGRWTNNGQRCNRLHIDVVAKKLFVFHK
jgi:hypothetical protein